MNSLKVGYNFVIPRQDGAKGMAGLGVVKTGGSWDELAAEIGVSADALRRSADRFNELARSGHDDDFNRGDSAYDNYYGDPTLPNRICIR